MLFPIEKKQLFVLDKNEELQLLSDYRCIVDTRYDNVIAIASSDYQIVKNLDLVNAVESKFKETNILSSYKITRTETRNYRLIRIYNFPNTTIQIDKEEISLALRITNSYNLSLAVQVGLFGWRGICENELVTSNSLFSGYRKHTKNIDLSRLTNKIPNAAEAFKSQVDNWRKWTDINLDEDEVEDLITSCFESKCYIEKALSNYKEYKNNRLWDAYQAVTNVSTHNMEAYTSLRNEHRITNSFNKYKESS